MDVPTELTITSTGAQDTTPTNISVTIAKPEAKSSIAPRLTVTAIVAGVATFLLLVGLLIGHNLFLKKPLTPGGVPTWMAGVKSQELKVNELTVTCRTPLEHLGTDWSFKDSWIANTTIGATALIALFAASDVLTTIFGSEQKNAIAFMAVTSALAAVLVSLGPLLIKVITFDPEVPIPLGLYIAGLVVVLGSMVQIWGATIQVAMLVETNWLDQPPADQPPGWSSVYLVGIAISVVVLTYAWRSLLGFVETGATAPEEKPSETLNAAKIIADAVTGSNYEPETTAALTRASGRKSFGL